MSEATMGYAISVYEPSDKPGHNGTFVEVARARTLWALRPAIREVRMYYDSVSYLIERLD
jgi:hypothetical protein